MNYLIIDKIIKEALDAKDGIIMLDNMDLQTAREAIILIDGKVITEFSGNVSLDNIKEIAELEVDFISVGALTRSAKILNLSMKNFKNI